MVMVKPGMIYLDIINQLKNFNVPVLAYQVSGEYGLIKNGITNKIVNEDAMIESIYAFKGRCLRNNNLFCFGAKKLNRSNKIIF